MSASCKKSSVDSKNAGSAKRLDHGNVLDQAAEYIFDASVTLGPSLVPAMVVISALKGV